MGTMGGLAIPKGVKVLELVSSGVPFTLYSRAASIFGHHT